MIRWTLLLLILCNAAVGAKTSQWELSIQSYTDTLKLKSSTLAKVPLSARATGLFAGYGSCMKFFGRACAYFSGGAGVNSTLVESASNDYIYNDKNVLSYQAIGSLGLKHHFKKSRSTALLSADLEGRFSSFRAPDDGYSIEDENTAIHYWIRAQFSFPISRELSFYQTFMASPMDSNFTYRLGISL